MSLESKSSSALSDADPTYVRMYYEHQYDRMAKQEEQRHSMSNIVVTLSVLAFTFGLGTAASANPFAVVILLFIILLANMLAILYMQRTRSWISAHRARAKKVLEEYAPALYEIDRKQAEGYKSNLEKTSGLNQFIVSKLDGRGRLQVWLHRAIVVACIALIMILLITY